MALRILFYPKCCTSLLNWGRLIIAIVVLFVFGVPVYSQVGSTQTTQEKYEAGVTVKVSLEEKNGTLGFKTVLDTHSVNLDRYNFAEIVVLRADGKEYKARIKSEEGSGHHRSAIVEFDNPGTKEVEVVIKDVAGIKERVFKFSL